MSLIGFRRDGGEIEYLEEVEYSEEHLEDDLHQMLRRNPRLVMGTLTDRRNLVLGSKPQLPSGKEPDLLACDRRGSITVIEFKRARTPRSAVTQLFDYASSLSRMELEEFLELTTHETLEDLYEAFDRGDDTDTDIDDFERTFTETLESPQLMLVAYTISDDVRRMTRWLREAHDLKINCVEFDYYERDDAEMFVPTVIGAEETQEIKEKEASPKQKMYRQFFGDVLERFKQQRPGVTNRSPTTDSWLTIPVGHTDVDLLWYFKGQPGEKALSVQMQFRLDDSERNQNLLDRVLNEIDGGGIEITEEVHSGEFGDRGYTRFSIEREIGRLEDALDDEDLKEWAVSRMVDFHDDFTPILDDELG